MKLLRMRLANWLTKGGYLAACKAATHWEDNYQMMQDKAVRLEQNLEQTRKHGAAINDRTEQHLRSAERALIEKDERINTLATENRRMSKGLDQIISYGVGKIEGRNSNGSLRRAVRMAEGALYPEKTDGERLIAAASEAREKVQQEMHL